MTASPSGSIVALTVHARHVAAPERQAFASRIQALPQPAVVIETCHRVEAYFMTGSDPAGLAGLLELPDGGAAFVDAAAIRHAMAVAVGRDSVVVGEDQVLHQVRQAAERGPPGRSTRTGSSSVCSGCALQAGRRARSWQQGPSRSLADVAIAAIEGRVGSLDGRDLLVVGAGRMGQLAARAGVAAGARVSIANRTPQAGAALAALTGSATLSVRSRFRTGDVRRGRRCPGRPVELWPPTRSGLGRRVVRWSWTCLCRPPCRTRPWPSSAAA